MLFNVMCINIKVQSGNRGRLDTMYIIHICQNILTRHSKPNHSKPSLKSKATLSECREGGGGGGGYQIPA